MSILMDINPNTPMASTYTDDDHIYRFVVNPGDTCGWDVRVERDAEVVWTTHYTDWHRVERARLIFSSRPAHLHTGH